MSRTVFRFGWLVAALAVFAPNASAQITWNVTYLDGNIAPGGLGFASPTVAGSTTVGQLRRDCVTASTAYLNTILDGRGTVSLRFDASQTDGGGFLASFGSGGFGQPLGSFQGGAVYQAARTGNAPFGTPHGSGLVDFGFNWHYNVAGTNTTLPNRFDLISTLSHEIGHALGFLNWGGPNGDGAFGSPLGSPDVYSSYDMFLQRGNTPNTNRLHNIDITQSNFGSFAGNVSAYTGGNAQPGVPPVFSNNTANGLYFSGPITNEAFNGPVPIYSPTTFQFGSSASHVNVGPSDIGLMNFQIGPGVARSFQDYEIAMMMDMGWNVYHWDGTSGNWLDGQSNIDQSRWRTDRGIVRRTNLSNSPLYNTFANPGMAPILPVYGQVTSNIILNFAGSGASQYTATNDIGNIRLSRLNLNSSSSQTNTITGGTLQFGVNSDNTASVLTPKIVQQNSGAFNINSNIVTTNTESAPGGGWKGFSVEGTGAGKVSLGGIISGNGTLDKSGTFTLELNGSSANTFTGLTTVNAGLVILNKTAGANAFAGSATINTGGTMQLAANNQMPESGVVKLAGGTLSTGATTGFSDIVGSFEQSSSSTIDLGTGAHTLRFTGISGTPTGTLTIVDWTGDPGGAGTSGRILLSLIGDTPNTTYAGFLGTIQFQTFATGATFIPTAENGVFELVPVPEPSTILAIAFATLGLGAILRRRHQNSVALSH